QERALDRVFTIRRVLLAIVLLIGEDGRRKKGEQDRRRQDPMMGLHLCHSSYEGVQTVVQQGSCRTTSDERRAKGDALGARGEGCAVLSQELVEDNTARSGDIQRLLEAQHRDAYPIRGAFEECGGEAIDFVAEDQADGESWGPGEQIFRVGGG